MSTQYLFLDNVKKEKFDLGTASWQDLLPRNSEDYAKPFVIQDLYLDENHLAEEMIKGLTKRDEAYYDTFEEALYVAKKLWTWSQGRTLYYSNDCVCGLPIENGLEIFDFEFKMTGSRYG